MAPYNRKLYISQQQAIYDQLILRILAQGEIDTPACRPLYSICKLFSYIIAVEVTDNATAVEEVR
jgi:hypothetical protein